MKNQIRPTFSSPRPRTPAAFALIAAALLVAPSLFAADQTTAGTNLAKNIARMNCGAQIEWTAPGGQTIQVANANSRDQAVGALIMDDDTVSCPLPTGETTFVVRLPATAALDRFSFVNENAAAAGQLKISVSNHRLPAASPEWIEVDGTIAFTHKRLFHLSMVGVEARYVKLSFQVEKAGRIASLGLYLGETLARFTRPQDPLQNRSSLSAKAGALHEQWDVTPDLVASAYTSSGMAGGPGATGSGALHTVAIAPILSQVSP